jgi:uncharacterized protein (TIGR03790 family)
VSLLKKLSTAVAALVLAACAAGAGLADRVVIVANSDVEGSVAVARHYAEVRGVPVANLIVLAMGGEETLSWAQFVSNVWQPLEAELVKRGWIDAIAMDLFDEAGRRKYAISGHRIGALVLCRGVPLRIAHDPALYHDHPPYTDHQEFRTNQAAVDSELSLLAQTAPPINGGMPNPLFRNRMPSDEELARVVKVSRLDGPTTADALGLVDRAVEAERTGLLGRAYVDAAGPHENGNHWLEAAASRIMELGFDLSVGHGPTTASSSSRIDAPVLYFGWYTGDLNGPFTLPGFRFPPGAVAVHIHSYSAQTLRSATQGWCGPLVARGVTATVGNVFEPYLEFTHRPDLLLDALSRGLDLVDAAYYALPLLSWQSIVIGDPLYRPFAVSLDEQTSNLAALPAPLAGYAVMRRMNLLDRAGKQADAIDAGRAAMKEVPSLALALALSRRYAASGNREAAAWTVRDAAQAETLGPLSWELMSEAGSFLASIGRSAEGIEVYRRLFDVEGLPLEAQIDWLARARQVALDSGDTAQAAEWKEAQGALSGKADGGKR